MSKPESVTTTLTKRQIEDCREAIIALAMINPEKGMRKIGAINELCNLAQLRLKFRRAP